MVPIVGGSDGPVHATTLVVPEREQPRPLGLLHFKHTHRSGRGEQMAGADRAHLAHSGSPINAKPAHNTGCSGSVTSPAAV